MNEKVDFVRIDFSESFLLSGEADSNSYNIMTNLSNYQECIKLVSIFITFFCRYHRVDTSNIRFSMRDNPETECFDVSFSVPPEIIIDERYIFDKDVLESFPTIPLSKQEQLVNDAMRLGMDETKRQENRRLSESE